MTLQERSAFCDYCRCPVLGRREGPNNTLHLIMTFLTLGLWIPIWLLASIGLGDFACPTCGGKVRTR